MVADNGVGKRIGGINFTIRPRCLSRRRYGEMRSNKERYLSGQPLVQTPTTSSPHHARAISEHIHDLNRTRDC